MILAAQSCVLVCEFFKNSRLSSCVDSLGFDFDIGAAEAWHYFVYILYITFYTDIRAAYSCPKCESFSPWFSQCKYRKNNTTTRILFP